MSWRSVVMVPGFVLEPRLETDEESTEGDLDLWHLQFRGRVARPEAVGDALARRGRRRPRPPLATRACSAGHRVAFQTAQEWVSRLEAAQDHNQLEAELRRLERYRLIVIGEIGYLPLERQAANLMFALVARRYERGPIIITADRGFEQWGEILGDAMIAAALIDRLVHHAEIITLKGKSYRLRHRTTSPPPSAAAAG